MMNSKRRDRRQRRMDVKQALQQGTSSKRSGAVPSSPMPDNTNADASSSPSNTAAKPAIPRFGSREFGHRAAETPTSPSTAGTTNSGSAKVFSFAEKTAKSPEKSTEKAPRQASGREQTGNAQQRSRQTSNLKPLAAVDPNPEASQPTRLRSLPTPLANPRPAAKPSFLTSLSLYTVRLMVLGVGIGVIAGTFLHHWNPATRAKGSGTGDRQSSAGQSLSQGMVAQFPVVKLTQPIVPLTNSIKALIKEDPELTSVVMVINTDTGAYVDIDSTLGVPAASTIKVPILVAFFQDVDAGKIRLDEALTMRAELVATGSGEMQDQPVGTKFTAWETVMKMIVVSDNTATNMVIDRMGGIAELNQRFKTWGLTTTAIRNVLPDLSGTNTTSARDLADLMLQINQGKLVSPQSRDRILSIMQRTVNDSLLPQGLGDGALISHKTGDIGSIVGDVGLIDLPNSNRYIIAVLVKRPYNDSSASDLIRRISQVTYGYFGKPLQPSKTSASVAKPTTATTTNSSSNISPSSTR